MSHFKKLWVMYRQKCPLAVLADYVEEYLTREAMWSFGRILEDRRFRSEEWANVLWEVYLCNAVPETRDRYDRASARVKRLDRLWCDLVALEQVLDEREVSHV